MVFYIPSRGFLESLKESHGVKRSLLPTKVHAAVCIMNQRTSIYMNRILMFCIVVKQEHVALPNGISQRNNLSTLGRDRYN